MFHTLTIRICIVILCIYAFYLHSTPAHAQTFEDQVCVSAYDKLIEYEDWDLDDLISYFQWAHVSENAGY